VSRHGMVVVGLVLVVLACAFPAGAASSGSAVGDASDPNSAPASLGYGFGAQINQPFHPVGTQAFASIFFFNLSRQDAFGAWVPVGGEGCSFFVNILDEKGRLVRRPRAICPLLDVAAMPIGPSPLRAGTFRRFDVPLPLVYASSETGDPDGALLPGGLYTLHATQEFNGPGPEDPLLMFGGGDPEARVPFRIYQCGPYPAGGLPMPMRELAKGAFSGYRNTDPNFFGEDLVLRTEAAGVRFWEQHTSIWAAPWNPPAVDFSREMVLVSLAGRRPSGQNSIQITSVEEKPCHLEVTVVETTAPIGIAAITSPFHMVAVPRSLKEVRFIHAVDLGAQ